MCEGRVFFHLMAADNSHNEAIYDRIRKPRDARDILKTLLDKTDIPIKHRLILLHLAIGSILLYGLHAFQINIQTSTRYKASTQNA